MTEQQFPVLQLFKESSSKTESENGLQHAPPKLKLCHRVHFAYILFKYCKENVLSSIGRQCLEQSVNPFPGIANQCILRGCRCFIISTGSSQSFVFLIYCGLVSLFHLSFHSLYFVKHFTNYKLKYGFVCNSQPSPCLHFSVVTCFI